MGIAVRRIDYQKDCALCGSGAMSRHRWHAQELPRCQFLRRGVEVDEHAPSNDIEQFVTRPVIVPPGRHVLPAREPYCH